jgi:hypothetical protein
MITGLNDAADKFFADVSETWDRWSPFAGIGDNGGYLLRLFSS